MQGQNFQKYKGIIPPLVTPLKGLDQLDVAGLERLVEHVLTADVSGVFILGTTGEFSNVSIKTRHELIERVCKLVDGSVNVLVGIADTSITESVHMAQKAADSGADAVVATPPYYYAAAQPELVHYFATLANSLPLPLFLYNMPVHTKTPIDPGTIKSVVENTKNVIGFKDSSANMSYLRAIQYLMKDFDFPLFVGPEEMTADAVLLGAAGGVNGGANMFPKLYSEVYKASIERDFDRLEILRNKVLEISAAIYGVGKYGASSYLQGLRCALSVLGICDDYLAPPFRRFEKDERIIIEKALEKLEMDRFSKEYL